MSPSRLSMRARLTLWNVAIVALALTVFGFGLLVAVERVLIGQVDRTLRQRMDRLRGSLQPPPGGRRGGQGFPEGRGGFRPPMPGVGASMPGMGVGVGPPPGFPPERRGPRPGGGGPGEGLPPRVLNPETGTDPRNGAPYSSEAFRRARSGDGRSAPYDYGSAAGADATSGGERLRVLTEPLVRDGRVVAVLQVAEPTDDVERARGGLTRALLFMIPASLLLAGLGGALLTERALRPVRALTRAASRIEAENLSDRLPVTGDDEFGRLTAMLNGMLERLEQAFQRQRRFTADASHELRTPLAVIKANSSLMREEAESLPEDAREAAEAIDEAADRANRLVRDLLFLARAEGGGALAAALPVQVSEVALADAARRAWSAATAARRSADQTLETAAAATEIPAFRNDVPADLRLRTDRDYLIRLLTNLFENAARHTPADGSVSVRARPEEDGGGGNGGIVLTVADSGEGIAPEHLARLGEPFYRPDTARTRARGGAGLGLAICRSLARALGGDLHLASEPGRGTTVTVTLADLRQE
ncbi:MAG TPA: HAMP domain-containing sensor histidine kinase [Armatimonadaceae bacterium]|nr:HAMP domain-containing sensor histidine kinase [Armatimonadaceae bacterium]